MKENNIYFIIIKNKKTLKQVQGFMLLSKLILLLAN